MNGGKLEGPKYQYYLSGRQKTICNHRQGMEDGVFKKIGMKMVKFKEKEILK